MKIVAATSNAHKIKEFCSILEGFEIISAAEAGFSEEIEENGSTFEENALIKARAVYRATGLPVLADDSGLCVNALGGAPGIYSARYAKKFAPGRFSDDKDANNRAFLLESMREFEDRSAYFCCAAAFTDGVREFVCMGKTFGRILLSERGHGGFGYDSLFFSDELQCTFAEATEEQKNEVSHRGRALRLLVNKLS